MSKRLISMFFPPKRLFLGLMLVVFAAVIGAAQTPSLLSWSELPELPSDLGVAGPFVGIHQDALIVAGGANFPKPVWENDKSWHDQIYVLTKQNGRYLWKRRGKLRRPIGYGAAVSTPEGVVCIGGNDADETFADVFLIEYSPDNGSISLTQFPALPEPCAYGSAAIHDNVIYVAGGQRGLSLDTAMNNFWSLDLSHRNEPSTFVWKQHEPMPAPSRALNITVAQAESIYVISGRRQVGDQTEFLKDVWRFTPKTGRWKQRSDAPQSMMAGIGIDWGPRHVFVLGGADGTLFDKADELRDRHPGFPKEAFVYDVEGDAWRSAGAIPQNHVTTIAVKWDGSIIVPSGEIRPRVRSPKIWKVQPTRTQE